MMEVADQEKRSRQLQKFMLEVLDLSFFRLRHFTQRHSQRAKVATDSGDDDRRRGVIR